MTGVEVNHFQPKAKSDAPNGSVPTNALLVSYALDECQIADALIEAVASAGVDIIYHS